ncbi:DUF2889 domain-containing protein [Candidatus Binatia bacterium]|jgi:hypothetical protein|nr:DUF2889 domain-containing protein [Candidatus Binatia bacterium]
MQLEARGLPIHTRSLSVTLSATQGRDAAFAAYVLDLRKRGFVPVAGDLQGTGIIHHMQLDGAIDPSARRLTRIAARMPTVAFEASVASEGESCRDLAGRVDHLAGTAIDGTWARALGAEIGGPRGCSHVLTLAQLLGPTAAWALDEDARLLRTPARSPGERIFRRDVTIDGYECSGDLYLTLQLSDLHLAPTPPGAAAADRFAAQLELRAATRLTMADMTIAEIGLAERRRTAADFETASWHERPDRATPLLGASLRSGISGRLLQQFQDAGTDRPLLDALLMLAPATVQCIASFIDTWTQVPWMRPGAASNGETGGHPDSCWMWRRDGALGRKRFG